MEAKSHTFKLTLMSNNLPLAPEVFFPLSPQTKLSREAVTTSYV